MIRLGRRTRQNRGQVIPLVAVTMVVLLLFVALVMDVGNWYSHHRHLQTQVDAGALAAGQLFSGCFGDKAATNAAIQAMARKYAGDPGTSGYLNPQIGESTPNVTISINSSTYGGPDFDGNGSNLPCSVKYVDVKAVDNDVPAIFKIIPDSVNPLDINTHARVEVKQVDSLTGLLPWAVPDVLHSIAAIWVNEGPDGVVGDVIATKALDSPVPARNLTSIDGQQLYLWSNATAPKSVNISSKNLGVVVLVSSDANIDLDDTKTLAQLCGQPNAKCYAGASKTSGLSFIHGYTSAGTGGSGGANPAPIVRSVEVVGSSGAFGASCNETAAGYFLRSADDGNGDCTVDVKAIVDFGQGSLDPSTTPTNAQLWVDAPGCGVGQGCPMTFNTGIGMWVTSGSQKPTLTAEGGRANFNLNWRTNVTVALTANGNVPTAASRTLAVAAARSTGTLIVRKVLVNDSGGTAVVTDFRFRVDGGSSQQFPAGGEVSFTVDSGTHSVVEDASAGYAATYSNCTRVNVAPGGSETCTITNNDAYTGFVLVKKVVINNDLGTNVPGDFAFSVDGGGVIGFVQQTLTTGENLISLPVGTHTITEPAATGYRQSLAGCSSIAVLEGQIKTCTITNDDTAAARIVIKKGVVNDDGGTGIPSDWEMHVMSGITEVAGSPVGGSATGTTVAVPAGTYQITETGPGGYDLSYPSGGSSCDSSGFITVSAGQTLTCVLKNDDTPASGGTVASGSFDGVAHPYVADGESGPVGYIRIDDADTNNTNSNSLAIGSHNLVVEVGMIPVVVVARSGTEPSLLLRAASGSGSNTQALDCDNAQNPAPWDISPAPGFYDEIVNGCQTPYTEITQAPAGTVCANKSAPTVLPFYCISNLTGGKLGQLRPAMETRFENPCTKNNWIADPNNQPSQLPTIAATDPRLVTLVISDSAAFDQQGSHYLPVIAFAGFYVTGWDSSGSGCPDNAGYPGGGPIENGDVWGHFVNFVPISGNGTPGPNRCNFNSTNVCIAVLTQ